MEEEKNKRDGMWSRIKEANRRSQEKEKEYLSTLNPEQRRKRVRRNTVLGCGVILIALSLCIGAIIMANTNAPSTTISTVPTDTPVPPTPTPNLSTHQGVETYTRQLLGNSNPPFGSVSGVTYDKSTQDLEVSYYISGDSIWDNGTAKTMIENDCFSALGTLWQDGKLKNLVGSITVHVESDLIDPYGKKSKGDMGRATLTSDTAQKFQWSNLDYQTAWDNQIYDEQWMLPDIAKS